MKLLTVEGCPEIDICSIKYIFLSVMVSLAECEEKCCKTKVVEGPSQGGSVAKSAPCGSTIGRASGAIFEIYISRRVPCFAVGVPTRRVR